MRESHLFSANWSSAYSLQQPPFLIIYPAEQSVSRLRHLASSNMFSFSLRSFLHPVNSFLLFNAEQQYNSGLGGPVLRFLNRTQTPLNVWPAHLTGRYLHNTQQTQETNIHILTGFEPAIPEAAWDLLLRPHCHRNRYSFPLRPNTSLSTLFVDSSQNWKLMLFLDSVVRPDLVSVVVRQAHNTEGIQLYNYCSNCGTRTVHEPPVRRVLCKDVVYSKGPSVQYRIWM